MAYPNSPPPPPPEEVASTNVTFNTTIRMDLSYITTHIGILRITIAILNAIGAICIACSAFRSNGRGVFFTVVALTGFFYTLTMLYAYTFHIVEKYHSWKWLKVETGVALVLVFFNLITSTIVVAFGSAAYSAAGFFGYLCMVSYGAEAWGRGRALRRGEPAQGRLLTHKLAPTVPSS